MHVWVWWQKGDGILGLFCEWWGSGEMGKRDEKINMQTKQM